MNNKKKNANADEIDGLKTAVTDLRTRLDALELKVDDHETRISALENPAFVGVSFSGVFTQGVVVPVDDPIITAWFEFKSKATGLFSSIEIRNNLSGPSVKCTDSKVATGIAKALNDSILGSTTTFTCSDGRLWNVIPYGYDAELNVWTNANIDQCDTYASVRPTKLSANWGGIGKSCGQPSQTLEVLLAR